MSAIGQGTAAETQMVLESRIAEVLKEIERLRELVAFLKELAAYTGRDQTS